MRVLKYLFISLVLALGMSFRADAVSDKMQEIKYIPEDAVQVANGYGWTVYQKVTERTEMYDASILYLENDVTNKRYILLQTRGDKQNGTEISIKASNSFAYGKDEYREKSAATYEYGYIQAVEQVFILAPDKIMVSGVPDCRNDYHYVIDLTSYTAVHIPAYNSFQNRTSKINGKLYLEFSTTDYSSGYREDILVLYDLEGNRLQ